MESLKYLLVALLLATPAWSQTVPVGSSSPAVIPVSGGGASSGTAEEGAAGGDLTGTYPAPTIDVGKVTSAKIADATITATDIATGAITSTLILNATILAADFAAGAVETAAILDATILAADLADGAVTTAKILDGTILAADFATGAVDTAAILDATILAGDLATGAVTSAKILDGTIATGDIATGAVTTTEIADATIAAADLATGSVTTAGILDGTIALGDIGTGAVTSTGILDATIAAADMAADSVVSASIVDATIVANDLATGAVTSAKILDATIVTGDLASGAVTSSRIADATIAAVDMAADSVETAAILNGTIIAADLATGAVTTTGILDATITDTDVAAANKDGASGTASLRTLGTGAAQAAAGNDSRITSATQGPSSAVDNECVRFDSTTGKLVQATSGTCIISDAGLITVVGVTTTGGVTISGVTTDITTGSNQDLTVAPNGTGSVILMSGDDVSEIQSSTGGSDFKFTTSSGVANRATLCVNTACQNTSGNDVWHVGTSANKAATALAWAASDSVALGSSTDLLQVYGEGYVTVNVQQAATCAAGVLALDPTSSVVYVNANNAACVITLGEANSRAGSDVQIILTANVSGAVTFPNVANVHAGPTACTTTGLSTIGSSYRVHYASTINEYVGVSCNNN